MLLIVDDLFFIWTVNNEVNIIGIYSFKWVFYENTFTSKYVYTYAKNFNPGYLKSYKIVYTFFVISMEWYSISLTKDI